MPEHDADAELRNAVERPETVELYGRERTRTPVLLAKVFGDGAQLISFSPVNQIPACYVVRVDGSWAILNTDAGPTVGEHSDEIVQAIADAFGISESEDDAGEEIPHADRAPWPAIDLEIGVYWHARAWPDGFGPGLQAPRPA